MAEKIKFHFRQQKIVYILSMLVVVLGLGMYLSLLYITPAGAVSGVILTDEDTTGYGLDGRDFSVSWTSPGSAPAGYEQTYIYITTSSIELTTSTLATACNGNPAQPSGMLMSYSASNWILPQFFQTDSCGAAFRTTTSYVAWVHTLSTNPSIVSSTAVDYAAASDTPVDNNAPQINHISVHSAEESADAVINSFITDDQTTVAQFANTGDSGDEYFKLYYGADVSTAENFVNAVNVSGNLFQFTVPSSSVPAAGGTFEYYLVANDAANNPRYICNDFDASSAADCQTSPFVVNTVSVASTVSISGTIESSMGGAVDGAKVFVGGFAKVATTTDASGNYILTGLPQNNAYDISASKEGYCEMSRFELVSTANLAGVNMMINYGSCGFFEGFEGMPRVMYSSPPDGTNYVPVTENIKVGFNQPMDALTVNDNNPTDAGSNVYLTTDDGTTKVAGSVVYYETAAAAQAAGYNVPDGDSNLIIFNPTASLSTSTFYTLVITSGVNSQGGQSVEGNRPGGGHKISFMTGGGFDEGQISTNFGQNGAYMSPFIRSMVPSGMGSAAAPNTRIFLEFNEPMNSATISNTNIKLFDLSDGNEVSITSVTLDSNQKRFVKIVPASTLVAGDYEVRVKGAVANSTGITIGPPDQGNAYVFYQRFETAGSNDSTGPMIYPFLDSGSTGVAVGRVFEFGFNESLDFTTINTTNITMYRGTTQVTISVEYDVGANSVFIAPQSALAPNTQYTINFTVNVKDAANNALASAQSYTYITGSADSAAPQVLSARCDDYRCHLEFSEPMNNDRQVDSNWAYSVLNYANYTLTASGTPQDLASVLLSYDAVRYSVEMENLDLTAGVNFTLTASSTKIKDLSGNLLNSNAKTVTAVVESSANTFGSFGGGGMFGPPSEAGGEFRSEGFGNFTGEQFMFGQADMAYPFNKMAGQDANVFQVRFTPGVVLQDDDIIELTFPNGTNVASVSQDLFSPFQADFNEFGSGSVTFGNATDVDGIDFNSEGLAVSGQKVYVKLDVSGTLNANDPLVVDLRNIINPSVPKGLESGGYTIAIKVKRGGSYVVSKTSMPYFINAGGTNSITVSVYAGSSTTTPDNVSGQPFLWGGGPAGPIDRSLTGFAAGSSTVQFTNLPNGCYNFGTDSAVDLDDDDNPGEVKEYYGKFSPESVCVNGGESATKEILLTPVTGSGAVALTVKFVDSNGDSYNFGSAKDIDIFAGGPGRFVVKNLTSVSTASASGYTLNIPASGIWMVGMGPAMPKSTSASKPGSLGIMPPPPVNLKVVTGVGAGISLSGSLPPGTAFNNDTDTLTFTFGAADKTITGTITDGTNPLANVEVFMHSQGFGAPVFTKSGNDGTFSLSVSNYGSYEIGAFKEGLPSTMKQVEIRTDGPDVGTDPDIYYNGAQVASVTIKLKKPSYYISGKVLDGSGSGIGYAPVFANDANGNFIGGGTDSSGNYTLYVDNSTWTVKSQLPPEKSETCGTFSKTVVVNGANMTNQNISPSVGSCYTLSGTVSADGTSLQNTPLFIDEWDAGNNRPVAGGFMRGASTDSNGQYSVKLGNGTYRVGTWHADYGEIGDTVTVSGANATKNLSVTAAQITFSFTGGSADMEAFIELKHSSFTSNKKRIGKKVTDLSTTYAINVEDDQSYSYFVDVPGVGKFTGIVAAGATATVNLGITASDFITVTGTVKDASDNNLVGALVTFVDITNNMVKTAVADSNGNYSTQIKAGTYQVGASLGNYVPGEAASEVTFVVSTTGHSFGSDEEHAALEVADKTIQGVVNNTSGSPMSTGYVWAENNDTGVVIKAPVDADDGSYSLPVTAGEWTVKAAGPLHAETEFSTTVDTSASSQTGKNFNLTADATREPSSASSIVAGSTGGSVDDSHNSGIKLTAGAGVLQTGSGNVTLNMEKTFTAPDSENFEPLSNATFSVSATGNSSIKNLNGNVEIQFDYADLLADLPEGVSEGSLQLMYYSPERGDYIPVEGGFTIDAENNTVTGLVSHFTDFVLAYVPPASSPAPSPSPSPSGGSTDITPPTNVSVAISGNVTTTVSTTVDLVLGATGANYMMIANFSDFTGGIWETYTTSKQWVLTAGNGTKIVYAKFKDYSGNVSAVASTTIALTGQIEDEENEEKQKEEIKEKPVVACSLNKGKAYKISGSASVYYITSQCTKRAFSRAAVYFTYFTSWKDVETTTKAKLDSVPDDDLNFMGWGPLYDPQYGALVKTPADPKVYLLLGGAKHWIASASVFNALKYSWSWIEDVAEELLNKYTLGSEINYTTHHPNYTLVKYSNSPKVYRLEPDASDSSKQVKRWVVSPTAFNVLGFRGDRIVALDSDETYPDGVDLTAIAEPTEKYTLKLNLSLGSSGEEVKQLQLKLKNLGYFTYPTTTGYYGSQTAEAVRALQKAKGLPVLGIVGPQTRDILNSL